MSGLTILQLLLLTHFFLSAKCHDADAHEAQSEEDFGLFYNITVSTQTTSTSWRDLQPNITPTVNAEGAREEKELFDNSDRQPDLLTSQEPDGISSITDYDYASNEYVTTDSNDLLTSKQSLLTVKWNATDAGEHFTKANLSQNQTKEETENIFEYTELKKLANIGLTEITLNEKNQSTQITNLINDTEMANIDSVESIFEELIENVTNLSPEDVSAIVDVDRIFSNDGDHFSTVAFADFTTVHSMNFHDLFSPKQYDNYTGATMENTYEVKDKTIEESSEDEPLTLVTTQDYLPGALTNTLSFLDASNSTKKLQFENLEESSGDGPTKTKSNTFSNNNFYEQLPIMSTGPPSTTFSKLANRVEAEKPVQDFEKDEKILFRPEIGENLNGFENEMISTRIGSSENIFGSIDNKSRVESTGNHKLIALERTVSNQYGHENFKSENEHPFVSPNTEATSNTNLGSETTTISYFISAQNIELFDGYKSTSQSGTEHFGLESIFQNSSEESQVEHFNKNKFFTEQSNVLGKETEAATVHNSENHIKILDLDRYEARHFIEINSFTEQSTTLKEEAETTSVQNYNTYTNVLDLDSSEKLQAKHLTETEFFTDQSNLLKEEPESKLVLYSDSQPTVFDLDMSTTLRSEVLNAEAFKLSRESKRTNKIIPKNSKNNIGEEEISNEAGISTTPEETTTLYNFDLYSTPTKVPSSDVLSTTPRNETRNEKVETLKKTKIKVENEHISSGDGPFTTLFSNEEEESGITATHSFSIYSDTLHKYIFDSDLATAPVAIVQSENIEEEENITQKSNVSMEDVQNKTENKFETVTDSNLSTTTDAQTENTEALDIFTKTDLEGNSHRMSKKLNHFVNNAEDNIENSVNAEEALKDIIDHSRTTQKIVVKTDVIESELHGEYVYTDVGTSKSFDGVVDQNFIEYDDVGEIEPVGDVEKSLVTEQNQIEQAFTKEIYLPHSAKTEEENKLPENNFQDVTVAEFSENIFPSTTEGYLNFTEASERTTVAKTRIVKTEENQSLTDIATEENKTARGKLEDNFGESTIGFGSNLDFSDFSKTVGNEDIFSSTTKFFGQHLDSTQENERTSGPVVKTTTEQSLAVNVEENKTVNSKIEDNFDGENIFKVFEETLEKLETAHINAMNEENFAVWATAVSDTIFSTTEETISSNKIQTTENPEGTSLSEFKEIEKFIESIIQNEVDSTTLKINQDIMSHKKNIEVNPVNEGAARDDEELMEFTTAKDTTISFKRLSTDAMQESVNFNKSISDSLEFITEKNSVFLDPYENEPDSVSRNNEFKNVEELTESTNQNVLNNLTTLSVDQSFTIHKQVGVEVNLINESEVRSGEGWTDTTTISFEKANTEAIKEDINLESNKDDRSEFVTEKSTTTFSFPYEIEESTTESISKYSEDYLQAEINNRDNEIEIKMPLYANENFSKTMMTLSEIQKNKIEEESNFSTAETTTSYVQKEVHDPPIESILDELTEDFTERAMRRLLKEAEIEEVTVIPTAHVKVTTSRDDLEENFANSYLRNSRNEKNITITKEEVPPNIDQISLLKDKSETPPTTEGNFITETQTQSLVSDLQNWKESTEEDSILKNVSIFEDIFHYLALTTTLAPVTLSAEIDKKYFTEETFSVTKEKNSAVDDTESYLEKNTEVSEGTQTIESINKQVFTVKTDSYKNFDDNKEQEIENTDNHTISTTMIDFIQERTSEEFFSEDTSTIVFGIRELNFKDLGSLEKKENDENITTNLLEFKTEVDLTTVTNIMQKQIVEENLSQQGYTESIEVKREEDSDTRNTIEIQYQDGNITLKKLEVQIIADMTTTVANDLRPQEAMTISTKTDFIYKNQSNSLNLVPNTLELGLKILDGVENEKEDKTVPAAVMTEWTTEFANIVQEETSEENSLIILEEDSTTPNMTFRLNNMEETTSPSERRNTVEQESKISKEITTSNFKLFNKVEVETNGRFSNPGLHLDGVSSNEEEDNNFNKEDRSSQVDRKRNENVQLDSPVVEIATQKQLTVLENTVPPTNHQRYPILNKSGKIFGEISKRIFQKYIDLPTTEENMLYKKEHATDRNYIVVEESEEDNKMADDEWIQTNGFIRTFNVHRNLQNANKTSVNATESSAVFASDWEIVLDYHHRTNGDLSEVMVTQKRDVILTKSVGGDQRKTEGNLDEPYLKLNMCSSWIEQKNRNCFSSGGLDISYKFGNVTTYIPATATVSGTCSDKNHIIEVNWAVNRTHSGILSLQLHIDGAYYWINSVYFQSKLPDKRHTQISVSDLVILETQVGDHMQGIINITSTSDLQLLIHVIGLTSRTVDDCTIKDAKVFLEHELTLIVGGVALATILVLVVAVLLLYKKFRRTASAYKMAIE